MKIVMPIEKDSIHIKKKFLPSNYKIMPNKLFQLSFHVINATDLLDVAYL
jgi:hypothetical protein